MDQAENMMGALYLQDLMRHMMINSDVLPMDKWYEVKELCPHPEDKYTLNMYDLALRYAEQNEFFIKKSAANGYKYRIQPIDYERDVILREKEPSYA